MIVICQCNCFLVGDSGGDGDGHGDDGGSDDNDDVWLVYNDTIKFLHAPEISARRVMMGWCNCCNCDSFS